MVKKYMKLQIYPTYDFQYNIEINYPHRVLDRTGVTYFEGNYTECLNYITNRDKDICKK